MSSERITITLGRSAVGWSAIAGWTIDPIRVSEKTMTEATATPREIGSMIISIPVDRFEKWLVKVGIILRPSSQT